jgi:hypothetical protein
MGEPQDLVRYELMWTDQGVVGEEGPALEYPLQVALHQTDLAYLVRNLLARAYSAERPLGQRLIDTDFHLPYFHLSQELH